VYEKSPLEAVNLGIYCPCVHVFVIDFPVEKFDSETSKAMRWLLTASAKHSITRNPFEFWIRVAGAEEIRRGFYLLSSI